MTLPSWILPHAISPTIPPNLPTAPTPNRQPSPPSLNTFSRRSFLTVLLASIALPHPARGVCGEPDPYFAHFTEWREGIVKMPEGGMVHYRLVGSRKNEVRTKKNPVVYIGDAGVGISAGETLELLGGDRRVLFTDMLGVGESDFRASAGSRPQLLQQAGNEVRAAVKAAGFTKGTMLHVIAAGCGVEVAEWLMEGLRQDGVGVLSVVVEGLGGVSADVSFEALLGKRQCAVEGGDVGNLEIARVVYGDRGSVNATEEAVKRVSESVTTMNLRTTGYGTQSLKDTAGSTGSKYVEKVISGNARLAHLANTEECLSVLDDFFSQVEQPNR